MIGNCVLGKSQSQTQTSYLYFIFMLHASILLYYLYSFVTVQSLHSYVRFIIAWIFFMKHDNFLKLVIRFLKLLLFTRCANSNLKLPRFSAASHGSICF